MVRYKLTREDLENFKRILALWEMKTLPAIKEEPPRPFLIPGANLAGINEVTNPEIILKSRVQPKFPKVAQGKKVLGRVVLSALILRDGTVGNSTISIDFTFGDYRMAPG